MATNPANKAAGAAAEASGMVNIDPTQIAAAAAAGAAQGAESVHHLGLSEEQFSRLSTMTMTAAATAAAKVSNDLHERRRKADRIKDLGKTAAVSAVVSVAVVAGAAAYQNYRNDNRGNGNRNANQG